MALPKRRHSKTRRDKRRTHWKLTVPTVIECKNCKAPRLPHHACPSCGFYGHDENKRLVLDVKERETK